MNNTGYSQHERYEAVQELLLEQMKQGVGLIDDVEEINFRLHLGVCHGYTCQENPRSVKEVRPNLTFFCRLQTEQWKKENVLMSEHSYFKQSMPNAKKQ